LAKTVRAAGDAIRDALADTLERVAAQYEFKLRFPPQALATAIAASLNGLVRAADPEALPDEVFAEFVSAVLGCAITAPGTNEHPASALP
jgi:hypothetical protein